MAALCFFHGLALDSNLNIESECKREVGLYPGEEGLYPSDENEFETSVLTLILIFDILSQHGIDNLVFRELIVKGRKASTTFSQHLQSVGIGVGEQSP